MDTVLAGPDGKPAIDAATGLPLTMEAMMARRGILAVNGASSPFNQQQQAQPTPVGVDPNAQAIDTTGVQAALAARAGATGGSPVVAPTSDSEFPAAIPGANNNPNDPNDPTGGGMWPWVVGGAGALGAAAYALKSRKKKPTSKMDSPSFGNTGTAPKPGKLPGEGGQPPRISNDNSKQKRLTGPDSIIEGEWDEVKFLDGAKKALSDRRTRKALTRIVR